MHVQRGRSNAEDKSAKAKKGQKVLKEYSQLSASTETKVLLAAMNVTNNDRGNQVHKGNRRKKLNKIAEAPPNTPKDGSGILNSGDNGAYSSFATGKGLSNTPSDFGTSFSQKNSSGILNHSLSSIGSGQFAPKNSFADSSGLKNIRGLPSNYNSGSTPQNSLAESSNLQGSFQGKGAFAPPNSLASTPSFSGGMVPPNSLASNSGFSGIYTPANSLAGSTGFNTSQNSFSSTSSLNGGFTPQNSFSSQSGLSGSLKRTQKGSGDGTFAPQNSFADSSDNLLLKHNNSGVLNHSLSNRSYIRNADNEIVFTDSSTFAPNNSFADEAFSGLSTPESATSMSPTTENRIRSNLDLVLEGDIASGRNRSGNVKPKPKGLLNKIE